VVEHLLPKQRVASSSLVSRFFFFSNNLVYMRDKQENTNRQNSLSPDYVIDPDSGLDMWVLMDNAHFAVARARLLELAQYELTKEQAQVLYVLRNHGGSATQAQIAEFTMRQHHSVSTLVNRMNKDGLVEKQKDPNGKGFQINITQKGKEKYRKVTQDSVKMIFSSLSHEERQQLSRYLTRLHNTARNLLGLDYKPPFLK
jgi:DNA-binding MarR family transcriptional regulator